MNEFTPETHRHKGRPTAAWFSVLLCLCVGFVLLACAQPPKTNGEIDVKPDIIRPSEAQSNFLDIGTQAGIEWLSFVPNDQSEYPDFFTGLDSDQKRRLRVAPLENPDERVLLEFKLPQGSKLWPVDWYGTELMAMEVSGVKNLSLALAKGGRDPAVVPDMIARSREKSLTAKGLKVEVSQDGNSAVIHSKSGQTKSLEAVYACRELRLQHSTWLLIAEWIRQGTDTPAPGVGARQEPKAVDDALSSISIKRELALEGLPKHKCTSSLDELKQGKLVFPGGTLNLPLKDGQIAHKTGGDSTIQVDGEGAKPWLLIRRLKEDDAPGDLRVRVRNDATFSRRTGKNPKGFGVGRRLEDARIDAVVWDYTETAAEQQLLGVIAIGNELLSIEVVSRGLRDGDSRRAARDAAIAMLTAATGTEAKGEPLQVLQGWNVGTMGK